MSKQEIEQAVDKMVEQEPDWNQVDFGAGPKPDVTSPDFRYAGISAPEPVEGERWYVASTVYDRFGLSEAKRRIVVAPSPLKAFILADGPSGRASWIVDWTREEENDTRFDDLLPQRPHPTVVVNRVTDDEIRRMYDTGSLSWNDTPDSLSVAEEESETGVGRSEEAALAALARASTQEPDWEEV